MFGVVFVKIKDICEPERGIRVVKSQLNSDGEFPVFQNTLTPMGYYDKYNCDDNSLYVVTAGSAGEIGYCNSKSWMADDCLYFVNLNMIKQKYIYYYLLVKQDFIKSFVRKASVPRLSRDIIENLIIPVVSIKEQDKIIGLLDKFDSYCNDISQGLPAEIELRKQQYEYYRNKLLTFEELK